MSGILMDLVRSFADTQKMTRASAFLQPVARKEAILRQLTVIFF